MTAEFGLRCLLARRMVERGVRFVQLYCGDTNGWDGHSDMEGNHAKLCAQSDLPVAGLLKDLKSRGLLDSTLVIWGGEFGRMPMSEGTNGRDHNPHGFSMWLAGGGVKGGQVIGATDAVGLRAEREKAHVHDIHATILHLLGFDHERLPSATTAATNASPTWPETSSRKSSRNSAPPVARSRIAPCAPEAMLDALRMAGQPPCPFPSCDTPFPFWSRTSSACSRASPACSAEGASTSTR